MTADPEQALAKHEVAVTLVELVAVASRLLAASGRLALIYPAERLTDVITVMRSGGLEPKRLQIVYPYANREAKRLLIEGLKNGHKGLRIEPPLTVHQPDGTFSPAIKDIFCNHR
jgi:tRNA1(Val) A37 N6-methylase TrmN6